MEREGEDEYMCIYCTCLHLFMFAVVCFLTCYLELLNYDSLQHTHTYTHLVLKVRIYSQLIF